MFNIHYILNFSVFLATLKRFSVSEGLNLPFRTLYKIMFSFTDHKVLTCVPLDVLNTFVCFHESLQKSKYSSRALKHSRKLLTLFLAYGQGTES